MSQAHNSFLIVKLADKQADNSIGGIHQYVVEPDSSNWSLGGNELKVAFVVSIEKSYENQTTNKYAYNKHCTYVIGDSILIDDTKIIHRFEDNTVLIRDDAIVAFYDIDNDMPCAGENQVVISVDRSDLEFYDVGVNGYVGIIKDVMIDYDYDFEMKNVEVGNKVILANPQKTEKHPWENLCAFAKISTSKGFFVIANIKTIACTI